MEYCMEYADLTKRNLGYIPAEAQARIRKTRLLIAGCGVGSIFAETAIRMGYEHLVLIDHDRIEPHNLNRQNYTAADIGVHKVEALNIRLKAINPNAHIEVICDKVTVENAESVATKVDLVFDTIDFLDLPGLVAIHDACEKQNKPLMTAVNAGFGAVGFYFPPKKKCTIRDLFNLPKTGPVDSYSHGERYIGFVQKISPHLDPTVVEQFMNTITLMTEGKPCPASQVAPGVAAVAALAGTVGARIAQGLPITEAPDMLSINMAEITTRKILA